MLATPSVTSLMRTRLAQGVTAPGLGEGRVTALASRLIALAKLPNGQTFCLCLRVIGEVVVYFRRKFHTELSILASTSTLEI